VEGRQAGSGRGRFTRSLELDPNRLKSGLNLARVLLDAHRPGEALATIDKALAIEATSSAAYRLKGRACHGLGRTDEAVVAYQTAIRLDPKDAWSMNNLAYIWIEQGEYDEALPALARAVELRKDVAVFYNNLGMALEHTGRFAAAADAYASAVNAEPSNENAARNRDRVSGVRDDPEIAAVDLNELARAFEATVETWTVSVAAVPESAPAATEAASADPDSTGSVQAP
jgi:Flp pilus assembly protein TadD